MSRSMMPLYANFPYDFRVAPGEDKRNKPAAKQLEKGKKRLFFNKLLLDEVPRVQVGEQIPHGGSALLLTGRTTVEQKILIL